MLNEIDDDLSSHESDSEDYSEEIMKIDEYRTNTTKNPLDYDSHCRLIKALKYAEKIVEAREARETMNKYYPLSPDIWMEWINDEKSINSDKDFINKLFIRATEDYRSVNVWSEYCQFTIGYLTNKDDIRQVFELAISQVGTHITKGYLIWSIYLIYEKASLLNCENSEEREYVYKIYLRQLSLPLSGNDETMKEFLEWNDNKNWENEVSSKYKLSKANLDKYLLFEEKLESIDIEYSENATKECPLSKESCWLEYLQFSEANCTKIEIINLFERAITELCLSQSIWINYLNFLIRFFEKDGERILNAYKRAIRNYKSSLDLWLGYVRYMEMYDCSVEEIRNTFNLIFIQSLNDRAPFIPLWQAYLDFEKRQLDKQTAETINLDIIRGLFDKLTAIENYIDYDPQCLLIKYWAFIEIKYDKNIIKSRELWGLIMRSLGTSISSLWLENLEFERKFGDFEHLKRLMNNSVNCFTDYPEYLFERILRIIAEESDLKTYMQFTKKIEIQQKKILERRMKEEKEPVKVKHNSLKPQKRAYDTKTTNPQAKKVKFTNEETPNEIRIDLSDITQEKPIERCDSKTVFISNLKYSVDENDLRSKFGKCGTIADIRIQKDSSGKSRGFAYIQFEKEIDVEEALKLEREPLLERPMYVSRCNSESRHSFSYAVGVVEKNKLFIKNLPKTVTKYALENIFKPYGSLKEVRLATFKSGILKGIAYVEYFNENDASKALVGTDGMEIGEKIIEVHLSKPPVKNDIGNRIPSLNSEDFKPPPVGMVPRTVGLKPMTTQKKIIHAATTGTTDSIDTEIVNTKKSNADFRKFLN